MLWGAAICIITPPFPTPVVAEYDDGAMVVAVACPNKELACFAAAIVVDAVPPFPLTPACEMIAAAARSIAVPDVLQSAMLVIVKESSTSKFDKHVLWTDRGRRSAS